MTWQEVEVDGATARIKHDSGTLSIHASEGSFAVETLEDASRANHKDGVLKRVSVVYSASPERTLRFEINYEPVL